MARTIIGQLIVSLVDNVSGNAKQAANSLKAIEQSAMQLAASGKTLDNWGSRFTQQLQRLKATPAEFDQVRASWERLQNSLKSGGFDQAFRGNAISAWRNQTIAALTSAKVAADATANSFSKLKNLPTAGVTGPRVGSALMRSNTLTGAIPYIGSGVGIFEAFRNEMQWSRQQNRLRASNMRDLNEAQMKVIELEARKVSQRFVSLPGHEVLAGATALTRAGQDQKGIAASLEPIAATAQFIEKKVDETAEDLTRLANIFRLPTDTPEKARKSFEHLLGLGYAVETAAPGRFKDFIEAMKVAGPAAQFTPGAEKTLASLYVAFDKAGYPGSVGGVAMRQLFKHLAAPKASALAMYAQKGINVDDFLIPGTPVAPEEVTRRMKAQFLTDISKHTKTIGEVLKEGGTSDELINSIYDTIKNDYRDSKGNISRQLEKSLRSEIGKTVRGNVSTIDVDKWLNLMKTHGLTLAQLIDVLEPRQVQRTLGAMKVWGENTDELRKQLEANGIKGEDLNKALFTGNRLNVDVPAAYNAADELNKRLSGAVGRLQRSFESVLRSLGDSGAIDLVAAGLERLGKSITNLTSATKPAGNDAMKDVGMLGGAGILAAITGHPWLAAPLLGGAAVRMIQDSEQKVAEIKTALATEKFKQMPFGDYTFAAPGGFTSRSNVPPGTGFLRNAEPMKFTNVLTKPTEPSNLTSSMFAGPEVGPKISIPQGVIDQVLEKARSLRQQIEQIFAPAINQKIDVQGNVPSAPAAPATAAPQKSSRWQDLHSRPEVEVV